MNIGDLVTWSSIEVLDRLDYGVVVGIARKTGTTVDLVWVKFITGYNAKRKKVLCNVDHLLLVKDIK